MLETPTRPTSQRTDRAEPPKRPGCSPLLAGLVVLFALLTVIVLLVLESENNDSRPTPSGSDSNRAGTPTATTGPVPSVKRGMIDESERPFPPQERKIAELLASEGKDVKALADTGIGRKADALVDGKRTEFKNPNSKADNITIKNQINNSLKRGGQARNIIIDARGTTLTESEAERGVARAAGSNPGKLDSVRIIGDDFDKTWDDFK